MYILIKFTDKTFERFTVKDIDEAQEVFKRLTLPDALFSKDVPVRPNATYYFWYEGGTRMGAVNAQYMKVAFLMKDNPEDKPAMQKDAPDNSVLPNDFGNHG